MPRRRLAWAELRVGILVLASFTILAIAIVLISGRAGIFTTKYPLKTYLPTASGLKKGSLVWLAGIEVGNIHDVNISPSPMNKVYVLANLRAAFEQVKAQREAAGVDQQTVEMFEQHLEHNLEKLSQSLRDGSYRPEVLRRVWIAKPGSTKKQPLDIPTVQDQVVQAAMVRVRNRAVEVIMRIDKSYQDSIREDSVASLGSIGLLGDKYIDISRGTESSKVIPPNGEVRGLAEADIKKIIQNSNDLVANLGDLVNKINQITTKIDVGQGTLGKFINDPSIFTKINTTVDEAQKLILEAKSGEGSIGKLIGDREIYDRLNGTLIRADNVMAKIERGEGTLGKFLSDPAVFNRAETLLAKFNVVADRMEKGEGFLGKLSKDETLYTQFRDTMSKFSTIADKMNQGEGTVGKLFVDPSLYSNLNSASAEVVKLLYDFRQNPKRFLKIKFGLF